MLKSQLSKVVHGCLLDHLDGVMDEDDIQTVVDDVTDELSHRFKEIEDDDEVFKANDLGFYEGEDEA